MPTAGVALNRAIAVGEIDGADVALAELDRIADDLDHYHPLHAARGAMLRQLGRRDEAASAYRRAVERAVTEVDRRFLQQQVAGLSDP